MPSSQKPDLSKAAEDEAASVPVAQPSWKRDLCKGLLWALVILISLLFYTGAASHFIYVDF